MPKYEDHLSVEDLLPYLETVQGTLKRGLALSRSIMAMVCQAEVAYVVECFVLFFSFCAMLLDQAK